MLLSEAEKKSLERAIIRAEEVSREKSCVQHVNIAVSRRESGMWECRFSVSDWFADGATVCSYSNGRQR